MSKLSKSRGEKRLKKLKIVGETIKPDVPLRIRTVQPRKH
jgi:hypothetical protein